MRSAALLLILCCGALAAAVKEPKFFARRDYPSAGGSVFVADVNGDGIPDLIAIALQYNISTMLGNGDGTFHAAIATNLTWLDIGGGASIDLNGDGKMDLIISGMPNGSGYPSGIGVCLAYGDGTFQTPVFYQGSSTGSVGNPVVGDFNGDGIPDVIVPGSSGMWLFTGKGGGLFNTGVLTTAISGGACTRQRPTSMETGNLTSPSMAARRVASWCCSATAMARFRHPSPSALVL